MDVCSGSDLPHTSGIWEPPHQLHHLLSLQFNSGVSLTSVETAIPRRWIRSGFWPECPNQIAFVIEECQ